MRYEPASALHAKTSEPEMDLKYILSLPAAAREQIGLSIALEAEVGNSSLELQAELSHLNNPDNDNKKLILACADNLEKLSADLEEPGSTNESQERRQAAVGEINNLVNQLASELTDLTDRYKALKSEFDKQAEGADQPEH